MGGVRADTVQPAGRSGWRSGWLLGVVVMAVVAGLALDQSGVAHELVWLGKAGRWTAHHNPDSVVAVAVASDGGVWAGTNAAGLVRWRADGSYRRHVPPRVAGQPVRHVAVADDGTVWAAVSSWRGEPSDRLLRFDGHRWRAEPVLGDDAANAQVESLAVGDDAVWVATDQGLTRFDGDEWTTPHTGDDGSPLRVSAVVVDDDGVVWAAVYGVQPRIIRFDGPHGSTVWPTDGQTDRGPPLAGETPLAVGADGSVWVATVERSHDTGARVRPWRFADGEWVAAAPGFDAPRGWVRAFTVDDDGQPWIAVSSHADGGDRKPLWHFDGRRWQRHGRSDGLPYDMVGSLTADDHGAVWAATVNGVARFADGEWTRRVTDDGPASDFVADLATGPAAGVWTAGSSGVSRFDGQQWTTWDADGVGEEFADHVAVGPDGRAWAATRDDVFRFDGEHWTAQPTGGHLGEAPVRSLAVGPTGAVGRCRGSRGPLRRPTMDHLDRRRRASQRRRALADNNRHRAGVGSHRGRRGPLRRRQLAALHRR